MQIDRKKNPKLLTLMVYQAVKTCKVEFIFCITYMV